VKKAHQLIRELGERCLHNISGHARRPYVDPASFKFKDDLKVRPVPSSNPSYRAIQTAPVVIALCGQKGASGFYRNQASTALGDWYMFDLSLAAGQLTLAVHALGLGTVHVGLIDVNAAGEVLGVPAYIQLVELVPLGYPDQQPKAPPRKPLSEIVLWERW
jgi:nitroreductase